MIVKGMGNMQNILEANLNYYKNLFGALPEDQKQEAERRYSICSSCPFNSRNATTIGFYETSRIDEHCSVCSCPIEKKVMSFHEQCGLSHATGMKDENGNTVFYGWKPLWYEYNINSNEQSNRHSTD